MSKTHILLKVDKKKKKKTYPRFLSRGSFHGVFFPLKNIKALVRRGEGGDGGKGRGGTGWNEQGRGMTSHWSFTF